MKLKKKPKKILITALVLIAVVAIAFVGYNIFFGKQEVKEAETIRLGTEYKENPVSSYSELEERYDEEETKDMGNTTLLKGHYVNKEALIKALSKYKLNIIICGDEEPISCLSKFLLANI